MIKKLSVSPTIDAFLKHLPSPTFVCDADLYIRYCSSTYFGNFSKPFIGKSVLLFVTSESKKSFEEFLRDVLLENKTGVSKIFMGYGLNKQSTPLLFYVSCVEESIVGSVFPFSFDSFQDVNIGDSSSNGPYNGDVQEKRLLDVYKYLGSVNRKIGILTSLLKEVDYYDSLTEKISFFLHAVSTLSSADSSVALYTYRSKSQSFCAVGSQGFLGADADKFSTLSCHIYPELEVLCDQKIKLQCSAESNILRTINTQLKNPFQYFLCVPFVEDQKCTGMLLVAFQNQSAISMHEIDFYEMCAFQITHLLKK